jgi:DNA mismatch repair protein MutL
MTELPEIRLLPPELADQIAAGEVVERPASVVKELVENALDAGARTIRVEIEGGGLDRIAVTDDGHGMTREGALLALQRHATSKLAAFDDLYRLSTFGFRGEAIPSIAAVSRFTLTTRPSDALSGTEIVLNPGEAPAVREVGAPAGTSIEVRELFVNVPARRKFLKSTGTEAGHVSDACVELALARHDVALTFARDGRVARQWLRAADRAARGRDVLTRGGGVEAAAHIVGERPHVRVEALLGAPERARSGATGLHLVVNGRSIRDRHLARAVAMAYGSVLDPGRYPLGIVWIDVPPEDVDVNVHPQKAEVRFSRGRELLDDVTRALAGGLNDAFRAPPSSSFLDSTIVDEIFPANAPSPAASSDPWGIGADREPPTRVYPAPEPMRVAPLAESTPPIARVPLQTTLQSEDAMNAAKHVFASPKSEIQYASLQFLAQVRSTYLICEGVDGIYVLDQHAAAERVTFARLREQHKNRALARQQLLVPEIVQVRGAESTLIDELREELLALGVDARAIGDGRVAVHGVPAILKRTSPEQVLRDVLDELARTGERKFGDAVDLVLATMACHGSVRAGDTLHPDEARALLRDLDQIDFAGYCPHGRPIVTVLPYVELERKVGRR